MSDASRAAKALQGFSEVSLVVPTLHHPSLGINPGAGFVRPMNGQVQHDPEILLLLVEKVIHHLQDRPGIQVGFPARLIVGNTLGKNTNPPRVVSHL